MDENFECKQCGNCCLSLGVCQHGTVSWEDVSRWVRQQRWDILVYVDMLPGLPVGDIWFHPVTREELTRCPFLRKLPGKNKYKCLIQDTKPEYCRQYPHDIKKAIETDCRGYNHLV